MEKGRSCNRSIYLSIYIYWMCICGVHMDKTSADWSKVRSQFGAVNFDLSEIIISVFSCLLLAIWLHEWGVKECKIVEVFFFFLLVYIGLCELMLYLFVMIVKWFFFLFFLSFILSLSMFFIFVNNWLYQQWNDLLYWSFCTHNFFFWSFHLMWLIRPVFFFLP